MATVLEKDVLRESKVKFDDREVQVTLTEKQTIFMKLKGMKTGGVEISIEDLYRQLSGDTSGPTQESGQEKEAEDLGGVDLSDYKGEKGFLISLHDIRHVLNVRPFEYDIKVKIDEILVDLINERRAYRKL